VSYAFRADTPVDLASLRTETASLRSFTVNESVVLEDRNGDEDQTDTVVTLRDRQTGQGQPLGVTAPPPGGGGDPRAGGTDGVGYCLEFGGPAVFKDTPATNGGAGQFKAKDAPAPATCAVP